MQSVNAYKGSADISFNISRSWAEAVEVAPGRRTRKVEAGPRPRRGAEPTGRVGVVLGEGQRGREERLGRSLTTAAGSRTARTAGVNGRS